MNHARILQKPSSFAIQSNALMIAGAGFLTLAGVFLWRQLALPGEYFLSLLALAVPGIALAKDSPAFRWAGLVAAAACVAVGGGWYAATTSPALLPSLAIASLASLVLAIRGLRPGEDVLGIAGWLTFAVAALASSGALYFHFLALGDTDLARRLVLTLGWLVAGLALFLAGRKTDRLPVSLAGLVWIAAAVLKGLTYDTTQVPIILLTSRGEEVDRVTGLESGADDYVVKPFSVRELCARIRAIARRTDAPTQPATAVGVLRAGPLTVDRARFEVRWRDARVPMTRAELALLEALARRPGLVLTRQMLLDATHGDATVTDRTVDTVIKRLRKKLKDQDPRFDAIETVFGVGYRWRDGEPDA